MTDNSPALGGLPQDNSPMLGGDKKQRKTKANILAGLRDLRLAMIDDDGNVRDFEPTLTLRAITIPDYILHPPVNRLTAAMIESVCAVEGGFIELISSPDGDTDMDSTP